MTVYEFDMTVPAQRTAPGIERKTDTLRRHQAWAWSEPVIFGVSAYCW